ncbi:hypothetical protein GCM10017673_57550 [Streptosporangium violaceochromogenes]|nr:hypothetical protein GCM10017673_57550 [Streptosporangium violaceochromogenes]
MGLYFSSVGLDQADQRASVVGALAGVASLLLAVYGMLASRATPTPASAEDTLAAAKKALTSAVSQQWRTEATIRSLDDPEPIPVSWHLIDDVGLMDHPRLVGEHLLTFTGSSDQVQKLARAFRALARRRLVITGGLGTGKTTLAIQLLLELLSSGADTADPVPVLLPVNGWDTTAHPRLHDWLAARLTVDYPALNAAEFGTNAAKALVTHGHILPILDGLDEIPEQARVSVISALNRHLAKEDQFILTTRTTEFATAVEHAGDVLTAAAVIAPAVITPADAETYLRTTLPPVPRHDWTPVWAALHSASCPGLSRLAETALGLWLIRTVYIPAADPAPLTGPQAQQETTLRAHLLDHLIAAVIDSRPPSSDPAEHFRPRTAWNPDDARAYLAYLARVLQQHNTYDLAWWQLAQHTLSHTARRHAARRSGLVSGLAAGIAAGLMSGLTVGLTVGSTVALAGWVVSGTRSTETPGYADLRLSGRTADLVKRLRSFLAVGLLGGLWVGFSFVIAGAPSFVIAGGFAFGLASGLTVGVISWAEKPASSTAAITPLSSWKADRGLARLRAITSGLAFGIAAGIAAGLMAGIAAGLIAGLIGGLMGGLAGGLDAGNHHGWLAYTFAVRRLAKEEHLPRKLMAFLDDAHRLGLLRTVGPIYQFRHAELQDHLAALPPPSSKPINTTRAPRSTKNAN